MYNVVTGKEYTGSNVDTLMSAGFEDPRFLTFNQARSIGRSVKKGSKGIRLCRVVSRETEGMGGEKIKRTAPKYFTVFNISQTEEI